MSPGQSLLLALVSIGQSYWALGLGFGDDFYLLQAELERAKAKEQVDSGGHAQVNNICQQLAMDEKTKAYSGGDFSCSPAGVRLLSGQDPLDNAVPQPSAEEPTAKAATDSSAGTSTSSPGLGFTSGDTLRYVLDVLVFGLVLDGLRRWRQRKVSNDVAGWAGLMQAALAGDVARCEALIRKATPITGADLWGCTVLHAASKGGSITVVKKLLEHGALVDEPDSWDDTPLHLAARAGHADVCELLLAHGAPIDAVNAQDWTPLVAAADAGQEAVCNLLLGRGAGIAGLQDAVLPPLLASLFAQIGAAKEQDVATSPEFSSSSEERSDVTPKSVTVHSASRRHK